MSPRLFALTIGIDKYLHCVPLQGAVSDADRVVDFLVDKGAAPERNRNLRNEQATRSAILHELMDLITSPSLEQNDPIVIYFAGRGTRAALGPPTREEDSWTPCLAPYDLGAPDGKGEEIFGIPDETLGSIMHRIASAKGNNIVR
jgi:Caspase domain